MNILYLDFYAGSLKYGRSFRPHYLGREWIKMGHKMFVFGASYSHLRRVQPNTKSETIDNINYNWLASPRYNGNSPMRFVAMFVFMLQLFIQMPRILKTSKPDAIIVSSTHMLDIFPAWIMAKITRTKLTFELHDVWPLSLVEVSGLSRYHPLTLVMGFCEWVTYKISDRVVSMLPATYDHMKKFGVREEQFAYVPNGISLAEETTATPIPNDLAAQIDELKTQGKFIIGYAGQLTISNAMDDLLATLKLLKQRGKADNLHVILLGDGQYKDALEREARAANLDNITFYGRVEKAQVLSILRDSDALYIGWKKQPIYRFGVSANKLFDYMMAQRPIIHAITAANDPVAEAGCGISTPAEAPDLVADAIESLMNMGAKERDAMGAKGRDYVLNNHEYKTLAARFITALK